MNAPLEPCDMSLEFMAECLAQASLHLDHALDHLLAGNAGRFQFDLRCFAAHARAGLETYREMTVPTGEDLPPSESASCGGGA